MVATDISLRQVTSFLQRLALSSNGVAMVLEKDGNLIGVSRGEHIQKQPDGTNVRLNAANSSDPLVASTYAAVRGPAEWSHVTKRTAPTLFDPVAVAYAIDAGSCPTTPEHIEVDAKGYTRVSDGPPNAQACLKAQPEAFLSLVMPRLTQQRLVGTKVCVAR